MVKNLIIGLIILCNISLKAQSIDAFATAKSNKKSVFIEQPFKVTITVYTATWFTQPLKFENLQIEGAFVQTFQQTLSSIKYVGKKKYASLEFYFIVFPYKDGEIIFPALDIQTETPPVGDYKGKSITLKTQAITIDVKPIPKNSDINQWLVATDASISNGWNKNLSQLKVGDVLVRTITSKAKGTLPTFIDGPKIDPIQFGSIYASEPKFFDERDAKHVNGKRIDTYSYLLEKAGEFTLPEVSITWYNPYVGKTYKREIAAYTLHIANSDNMEALTILKDSLNALNITLSDNETIIKPTYPIKKWLINTVGLILIMLAFIILYKITHKIIHRIKEKQRIYRNSELYWFKRIKKQQTEILFLRALYQWLNYNQTHITLREIKLKEKQDNQHIEHLKANLFSYTKNKNSNILAIKKALAVWRKKNASPKVNKKKEVLAQDINS